jgi:hypothetical protein
MPDSFLLFPILIGFNRWLAPFQGVPSGPDQTFYIVINNYGTLGPAFAETDVGEADLETTVSDLMSGQYNDPVRIVGLTPRNIGPSPIPTRRAGYIRPCGHLVPT